MFFLLVACLGQSLLAQPTLATRLPTPAAHLAQVAPATRPIPTKHSKQAKAKADKKVHAIKLGKCDTMGDYDIPAQRFDETMQQITHATGCGIFDGHANQAESDFLSAIPVSAVRGHLSVRDAMLMALKGSSYEVVREKDNILYVQLRK